MPLSRTAIDVVFDALVESKSSLVSSQACDERRGRFFAADGGLDEGALAAGLYKSRALVIFSSTTLGKVVTTSDDGGDELLEAVGNKERLGELLALKPEAQTWSNWLGISS